MKISVVFSVLLLLAAAPDTSSRSTPEVRFSYYIAHNHLIPDPFVEVGWMDLARGKRVWNMRYGRKYSGVLCVGKVLMMPLQGGGKTQETIFLDIRTGMEMYPEKDMDLF